MHFPCVPDGNNSALVHDKWRMTSHHLIQYWHCRRRIYKSTVGQALHLVGLIDDMFWKTKKNEIHMKQCIWINTAIGFYIKTKLIYLYDLYSRYKLPIQSKVVVNDTHQDMRASFAMCRVHWVLLSVDPHIRKPRENCRHFADDIFECIFLENV